MLLSVALVHCKGPACCQRSLYGWDWLYIAKPYFEQSRLMPYYRIVFGKRITTASKLTLARLFLAPVFLFVFLGGVGKSGETFDPKKTSPYLAVLALILYLFLEASDIADGIIARKTKAVSSLGKILDPLADVMNHMGAYIAFLYIGIIPVWFVVLFFYREAIVSFVRVALALQGKVLSARFSGKVKTFFLGLGGAFLCFLVALSPFYPSLPVEQAGMVVAVSCGLVLLYSLGDYVTFYIRNG